MKTRFFIGFSDVVGVPAFAGMTWSSSDAGAMLSMLLLLNQNIEDL
jgi:hypothetical protein